MQPLSSPRFQAFKDDGSFAVGWKLYSYSAGTSTPLATYTDQTLASANTNPVLLDATGSAEIWLDPAYAYKIILTDDADVVQWSCDQVNAHGSGSVWLGDANFYSLLYGNPIINFDANDYILFDRTANTLNVTINNETAAVISSSGIGIAGATVATSLTVGGGTPMTKIAVYSPSLDVASVAANSTAEQDFTVSGLTTADKVIVNKPSHTVGLIVGNARVKAADTLSITFGNLTGSPIDPGVETYQVIAIRS